jgi:hypothetical protein
MRYDYKIAMVSIFAIMSIATGAAFADDKLKGPYAVTGTQMCLTAPSGFANDSKGNPTIANGKDNLASVNNFQGRFSFNGDGTGSVSGNIRDHTSARQSSRLQSRSVCGHLLVLFHVQSGRE